MSTLAGFFFCPTTKTINNVFFCLVLSASLIKFFFFAEQLRFQTGGKCSDPGHVFEVCWHVFSNFPDSSFPFFICQFWSLNLFSSNIKNDLDAPPPPQVPGFLLKQRKSILLQGSAVIYFWTPPKQYELPCRQQVMRTELSISGIHGQVFLSIMSAVSFFLNHKDR